MTLSKEDTEVKTVQSVQVNGEKFLTPRAVRQLIVERVGAEFTQRQVDRLGSTKTLQPRMIAGRRFYRQLDVERLLNAGHIAPSETLPGRARLVRKEARMKRPRGRRKNNSRTKENASSTD